MTITYPSDFMIWMDYARTLPVSDVERSAAVSLRNRHSCRRCFECACAEVLRTAYRRAEGKDDD